MTKEIKNPFLDLIAQTLELPKPNVITVHRFGDRKDSSIKGNGNRNKDWSTFWNELTKEAILQYKDKFLVTFNASPHTEEVINYEGGQEKPAHLLVWANTINSETVFLKDDDVSDFSQALYKAVSILVEHGKDGKEKPLIYSLQGFTDKDNQIFSSGPQSNPFLHFHVALFGEDKKQSKPGENQENISFVERLKYYGFFNRIILNLFFTLTTKLLGDNVTIEIDEKSNGLRLKLKNNNTILGDYLALLGQLKADFNNFYQGLIDYYRQMILEDGRFSGGNIDKLREALKNKGINYSLFDESFFEEILNIMSFIRPSSRLIEQWLEEEKDNEKRKRLEKMLERNKKRKNFLRDLSDEKKKGLKKFFKIDDEQLEGFLLFLNDIFLEEETDKPKFTFPQRFPFGVLIDDYDIDNEGKKINLTAGIKIRPMFFTLGGNMAEQITGSILRR